LTSHRIRNNSQTTLQGKKGRNLHYYYFIKASLLLILFNDDINNAVIFPTLIVFLIKINDVKCKRN